MNSKKYVLIISILALSFCSCERNDEIEGPLLEDLYGELNILEPLQKTKSEVDFSNLESVHFTMKFSKLTNWNLKVIGMESNATAEFKGLSRELNAENTSWEGSVTKLPMFRVEKCLIDLYLEEIDSHYYDTIDIKNTKTIQGFLIEDFETEFNADWEPFVQSGANMSFVIRKDSSAAQGTGYYDMGGEVNWDYLIGLVDIPASAYGENTFPLQENANNVYFNFMLRVPDNIQNAIFLMQFREDENGDGNFTENNEDLYSLELKEFEKGWQLISVRYSDLVSLVNGEPATPRGNGIHEPHKLWKISILMLADPATGYSQTLIDYLIFTENQALKP